MLAASALLAAPGHFAQAQDFPTKPVRIIVPFAPGAHQLRHGPWRPVVVVLAEEFRKGRDLTPQGWIRR